MWFHIINRGADRQDIFHDDPDRLGFEALFADAVERFPMEIHAYCLMTNHVHALVHCRDDVVSEAWHRIATIHAGRFNHRYERSGPLFEGRFRSVPVTSDAQLLQVSRYIHRNPAAIVGDRALSAYRWSSYGAYVGGRTRPGWLATAAVLGQFGGDAARYRSFVSTPQPSDPRVRAWDPGDALPLAIAAVEATVADVAGLTVDELHRSQRGVRNDARLVAVLLLTEDRIATAPEVAVWFGLESASSARAAARRARVLRSAEPAFRRLWERARAELGGAGRPASNAWEPSPNVA
jgi:REP element-mobilizing transposase RayT